MCKIPIRVNKIKENLKNNRSNCVVKSVIDINQTNKMLTIVIIFIYSINGK